MHINICRNIFSFIRIVAPKKEFADAALADLKEKEIELLTAQQKLSQIQKLLLKLKIDFDIKMEEKEQLVKKVNLFLI